MIIETFLYTWLALEQHGGVGVPAPVLSKIHVQRVVSPDFTTNSSLLTGNLTNGINYQLTCVLYLVCSTSYVLTIK